MQRKCTAAAQKSNPDGCGKRTVGVLSEQPSQAETGVYG